MGNRNFVIVGIGASAGGLSALQEFFRHLPPDLPAAYVVITHLQRGHESHLSRILDRDINLRVQKISGVTYVEKGVVYVMPEDVVVKLRKGFLFPYQREQGNNLNKAIDIFLESLAVEQKHRAIGVILSGMGSDGSEGAKRIYEHGGEILVQDPETTPYRSMPWATIMKDHPDYILPPDQLGKALAKSIMEKIQNIGVRNQADQ